MDRVFVTWTQQWSIDDYVENYLRTRGLCKGEHGRVAVLECLRRYTGGAPVCKSDLDYFLDANLARH
jgi:hypothetical protein